MTKIRCRNPECKKFFVAPGMRIEYTHDKYKCPFCLVAIKPPEKSLAEQITDLKQNLFEVSGERNKIRHQLDDLQVYVADIKKKLPRLYQSKTGHMYRTEEDIPEELGDGITAFKVRLGQADVQVLELQNQVRSLQGLLGKALTGKDEQILNLSRPGVLQGGVVEAIDFHTRNNVPNQCCPNCNAIIPR